MVSFSSQTWYFSSTCTSGGYTASTPSASTSLAPARRWWITRRRRQQRVTEARWPSEREGGKRLPLKPTLRRKRTEGAGSAGWAGALLAFNTTCDPTSRNESQGYFLRLWDVCSLVRSIVLSCKTWSKSVHWFWCDNNRNSLTLQKVSFWEITK